MPQRHTEGEVSIAPIIFNLCTSWRQRSASHPGHSFPHRNSSLYPLNRSLCGSLAGLDVSKKRYISCHCRDSNPRSSSLQVSHYTDSVIPSPTQLKVVYITLKRKSYVNMKINNYYNWCHYKLILSDITWKLLVVQHGIYTGVYTLAYIKNKSFLQRIYCLQRDKRHLNGNKILKLPTVKIISLIKHTTTVQWIHLLLPQLFYAVCNSKGPKYKTSWAEYALLQTTI